MRLTSHALDRAKERFDWDKELLLKKAKKASKKGVIVPDQMMGIDNRVKRYYKKIIFVFQGDVLVTVVNANPEEIQIALGDNYHTRMKESRLRAAKRMIRKGNQWRNRTKR